MFLFYIFHSSFLLFLTYLTLKYIKKKFLKNHNGNYYNRIVKDKYTYILIPSVNHEDFKNAFILKSSKYDICGFDCEWAPNKNISLIQISFPDGYTFLIRLFDSKTHIPNEISNWFKDGSKLKFGVGVLDDARKLESQWNIDLRGSVDLRHLAVRVKPNGLNKMGLKSLASSWLHINYPYEDDTPRLKNVQCSNWEQNELSIEQIEYACLDGIVGALCPIEFLCRKLMITPQEALHDLGRIKMYCQGCIDLKFKTHAQVGGNNMTNYSHTKRNSKNLYKIFKRVGPIYDNASLLTPDGTMLSRLSHKKADWYLRRQLGVKVSEDPFVVKLLFEPSGRATGDNDYYVQEKENVCVVCGSGNCCVRKNIIPIEYRKHYPVSHKSHKSHDVLPLCADCHRHGNILDDLKKRELSSMYNAPLGPKESIDNNKSRAKNAARALRSNASIPANRMDELKSVVASYYGVDLENMDSAKFEIMVDEAVNLTIGLTNGGYVPHGQLVVATLKSATDLVNFEVMWREHFVDRMQPKFLPTGWSTHHRSERYCLIDPK